MFSLHGKTALISGASRGIGLAIARKYAQAGARIIGLYQHNHEAAQQAQDSLNGSDHEFHAIDLSQTSELSDALSQSGILESPIDILVNNAGIFREHAIDSVSLNDWLDEWQQTLAINLMAPAMLSYLIAKGMIQRGQGRIVNISSRGAFRGEPECPAYGASKAGLNALTQSLAQKLAPYGISVAAIAPGFVETDMVTDLLASEAGDAIKAQSPFNRVAKPDDVAAAALFLASDEAEFSSGTIIDVNGASYLRS